MKNKIIMALAISFVLGTTATFSIIPSLTVFAHQAHMTDRWVIDAVKGIKKGNFSDTGLAEGILRGSLNQSQIVYVLDSGVCTEYIDTFKENGLIPQDYGSSGSATPAPTPPSTTTEGQDSTAPSQPAATAPATPTYTVSDMSAIMYATQQVNLRSGASSEYSKLGALSKDQSVSVTGIASTGWYRISWNNTDAFVSNKYLTDKAPSKEVMSAEVDIVPETIPSETESTVATETQTSTESATPTEVTPESISEKESIQETETITESETPAETEMAAPEETKSIPTWVFIVIPVVLLSGIGGYLASHRKSNKK